MGGTKARWFQQALGFTKDNLDALAKQIVFNPTKAVTTEVNQWGQKFTQTITIVGANGKVIDVVFAWIQSKADGIVRLVTAIPTEK